MIQIVLLVDRFGGGRTNHGQKTVAHEPDPDSFGQMGKPRILQFRLDDSEPDQWLDTLDEPAGGLIPNKQEEQP